MFPYVSEVGHPVQRNLIQFWRRLFPKRWFVPVFVIVAIVFFAGTLVLPLASHSLFISPDETANAFFARQFSEIGSLRVDDPLTGLFEDQLYPRSVVAVDGTLVPQSFVGLPVMYGTLVYFFGTNILFVLTPLLAILAALAFRSLLRTLFSPLVADLSAMLFLLHPALWYYSARGLMHNVLFVSLLIFSAYFFFCRPLLGHLKRCEKRLGKLLPFQEHIDPIVSGLFIGLSIFVRASEVYWVLGIMIFLFIFGKIDDRRPDPFRFALGALIGILPFFLFNFWTYGHPLVTGYTVMDSGGVKESWSDGVRGLASSANLIFPFGLDLKIAASHVADYGLLLFWWLSALSLIGFAITLSKQRLYAIVFVLIAVWLGLWYGSWTFFDNPDSTQVTIANSYVRYWMPVSILALPFVAEAIVWISARAKTRMASGVALAALLLLTVGLNVRLVFFEGQDHLVQVADTLRQSQLVKEDVLSRTQRDAVIIVDRADKLFFPERHVRYPLRSEETYALMPKIVDVAPLYYYGITFPQKDIAYLNDIKLKSLGLEIEYLKTYHEESLYRLWSSD